MISYLLFVLKISIFILKRNPIYRYHAHRFGSFLNFLNLHHILNFFAVCTPEIFSVTGCSHSATGFPGIRNVSAVRALENPDFILVFSHYAKIATIATANAIADTAFQSISNCHTSNMFIFKISPPQYSIFSNLSFAISKYFSSSSTPIKCLPHFKAAIPVFPVPINGSKTILFPSLEFLI